MLKNNKGEGACHRENSTEISSLARNHVPKDRLIEEVEGGKLPFRTILPLCALYCHQVPQEIGGNPGEAQLYSLTLLSDCACINDIASNC